MTTTIKQLKKENKVLARDVQIARNKADHYEEMFKISSSELEFLSLLLEVANSTFNEIREFTTDKLVIHSIDIAQQKQVLDKFIHNRKLFG